MEKKYSYKYLVVTSSMTENQDYFANTTLHTDGPINDTSWLIDNISAELKVANPHIKFISTVILNIIKLPI
jgi:hypothetical protein